MPGKKYILSGGRHTLSGGYHIKQGHILSLQMRFLSHHLTDHLMKYCSGSSGWRNTNVPSFDRITPLCVYSFVREAWKVFVFVNGVWNYSKVLIFRIYLKNINFLAHLSWRLSELFWSNFSHFHLFFPQPPISTKLGTKHPWVKRI